MELQHTPEELGAHSHAMRFSRHIFDAIVDPLIIVDAVFRVEALNPAAQGMFSEDTRLCAGAPAMDAFTHNGVLLSKTVLLAHARQGGQWSGEVLHFHSGKSTLGQLTISPVFDDGITAEELLKNADTAMYRVKDLGREGYRFYQTEMNVAIAERMRMDQAMRQGLTRGEFFLNYQPQIDLSTGARKGVEALLRWIRPEQGFVSPGVFIPVAEETGFIVALGQWVLEEGLRQSAAWREAGMPTKVAVNVSAIQFRQAGFVESVKRGLEQYSLPAELLELELTESILVVDMHEALEKLKALNALGVHLSIDDFGTGYSSLAYLKTFPIQTLKVDRSFVKDLLDNKADRGIADAIITLGRSLGLNVVAEGVETIEQARLLRDMGCHEGQGFLWSPAVAPLALENQVYYLHDT